MDFAQAQSQLARLKAQLAAGQIPAAQYTQTINQLRVQDQAGVVWQPNPAGPGWIYWSGEQWLAGVPSGLPAVPPPPAVVRPAPTRSSAPRFLSPQRFTEISQKVPLRHRPQAWWDVLSLWAGAACGYFWLLYSLVRGLPRLRLINNPGNTWLDLLPSLALLCLPLGLLIFRQAAMPALSRWMNGLRRMPLKHKLGWTAVVVVMIAVLQTNNPLFAQREGLDLITPLLMFLIPLTFVWYRSEIDRWLLPLQPILQPIPKLLLTVIGLGAPFLIGYVLYNGCGISQYQLLRLNVVLGMVVSYIILRTPEGAPARPAPSSATAALLVGLSYVLYSIILRAQQAWADDFLTDPFNLKDGLRTNGIASALSGGASSVNTLFVNGVEVVRNASGPPKRPWTADEQRLQRTWSGGGQIVSGQGAIDWLKQHGMLTNDGRINDAFRNWFQLLPGDANPTQLDGVFGEFRQSDTTPLSDQITIVLRDPNQPQVPASIDEADIELLDADLPSATDLIPPTDESLVGPPDFVEEPHVHNGDEPPPPPGQELDVEPGAGATDETAQPETSPEGEKPPPPGEPPEAESPPTTPQDESAAPPAAETEEERQLRDILNQLRLLNAGVPPGMEGGPQILRAGFSPGDIGKWLEQKGDWLRGLYKDLKNFKDRWYQMCHDTYKIDPEDKLPQRLRDSGLFDASRESGLSQGLRQTMLIAGNSKEYVDALLKKIEADDSQRKRIADLAYEVLDSGKSLAATAGSGMEVAEQFGTKAGVAAAAATGAQEFIVPDPTDFTRELLLAQKSHYNDSINNWRESQTAGRWASTGAGVSNPTTTQDVDKLLRGLQAEQRQIKAQYGNDPQRFGNDPQMRRLWAEEAKLRDVRNNVADLNVLQRGGHR